MNGGYVLIDCTGLDLTKGTTEQTVSGIFSRVDKALAQRKPIIAENATWGTLSVSPIACFGIKFSADQIIVTSSTLQIIIGSDDVITINNLIGG